MKRIAAVLLPCLLAGSPALAQWPGFNPLHAVGKGAAHVGNELGKIGRQGQTDVSNGLNSLGPPGQAVNKAFKDLDQARLEFQSSVFTGPALEQWFNASRNTAMNGAQPIPPHIRAQVQHLFAPEILNKVRWKIGDNGAFNLANMSIRYGDANAVTLIDVVVFANPQGANDPALWTHELTHVRQFHDWGVHAFAVKYMRSWNSVEDEGYNAERAYRPPQVAQPRGPQPWPPQQQQQQWPPQQVQQPWPPQQQQASASMCIIPQMNSSCMLTNYTPVGGQCGCTDMYGRGFYGFAR